MQKFFVFEHRGGNVIISDPNINKKNGITNMIYEIPAFEQKRWSLLLPADKYECYVSEHAEEIRIIRQSVVGDVIERTEKEINTGFSRNLVVVGESHFGSSEYLDKMDYGDVQFRVQDMLAVEKKHKIKAEASCHDALVAASKDGSYPFASVLCPSLKKYLKDIENTSWGTYVMLAAHESEDFYTALNGGVSLSLPVLSCMVSSLYDSYGCCGIVIRPQFRDGFTIVD